MARTWWTQVVVPTVAGALGAGAMMALVAEREPGLAWTREALAQDPVVQSAMLADVTERALQSVVSIRATRADAPSASVSPLFPFGSPSRPGPLVGTGSGVILSEDGRVVTNHHVVAGADRIEVQLPDRRTFLAQLVGSDEATDIALLQIEDAPSLPALRLGDSTRLRPGELVLAIGNPFGLSGSASLGIVSATGRANMGITDYEDFIQTDAAINPGNSGGALVNMYGQLVGINTAIFSRSGGNQGIGFAIPAHMVEEVASSLARDGMVRRGWLGVSIRDVGDKVRSELGDPDLSGVELRGVEAGAPAAAAGLRAGDIIVAVDGVAVDDANALRNRIARAGVDTTVMLDIVRDGARQRVAVPLAERPELGRRRGR